MATGEYIFVDRGPRLWEIAIRAIASALIISLAIPVGIMARRKLRWSTLYVALIVGHVVYTGVGWAWLALIPLAWYWIYIWYQWSDRTATPADRELFSQASLPTPNHFGL
ncbi:MAG TPA: hypothetical protein VLF41_03775 [Candidatus Nanoarchaeia archaeon]|nr:hypothetical protein [Candidatus Nanoarchaeia archaeon]